MDIDHVTRLFHTVQLPTISKPKDPKDLNFTNSIPSKLAIQIAFLSKLLDLQPWFLPSPSPHGGHVVFQTLCFPERHGPFDEPAQTLDPYWHPRWRPNSLFFSTTSVRGGWRKDESFGVPGLLRKAHLPSSNSDYPNPVGNQTSRGDHVSSHFIRTADKVCSNLCYHMYHSTN